MPELRHKYLRKVREKVNDWFDILWEDKHQIEVRMYYGSRVHLWVGFDSFRSGVYAPPEGTINEELCTTIAEDLESTGLNVIISLKTEHIDAYPCFGKLMAAHDTTFVSVMITN